MKITLTAGAYHLFLDKQKTPAYPVQPTWKIIPEMPKGFGVIYPNPTSGNLNLLLNAGSEVEGDVLIEVFDPVGRLVASVTKQVREQAIIPLNDIGTVLKTGLYLFRFSLGEASEVTKVVVF
jgi:hypothetical protein